MSDAQPIGFGVEEPPNRNGAFPRMDDDQLARFRMVGDIVKVQSGEVLFREGEEAYDFFVVESGAVTIVNGYGKENRVIAVHGARRFLGELSLLTRGHVYLTAVVRDPGTVIRVPRRRFVSLLRNQEDLANLIFAAFMARREILIERG